MGSIFARAAPRTCFVPSACTSRYYRHQSPTSTLTGRLSGSVWIKFWTLLVVLWFLMTWCSGSALMQKFGAFGSALWSQKPWKSFDWSGSWPCASWFLNLMPSKWQMWSDNDRGWVSEHKGVGGIHNLRAAARKALLTSFSFASAPRGVCPYGTVGTCLFLRSWKVLDTAGSRHVLWARWDPKLVPELEKRKKETTQTPGFLVF